MPMKTQTFPFARAICMKLASDLRRQELIMQSVAGAAVYIYSLSEVRCSLVKGFVKDHHTQKRIQNGM